MKKNRHTNTQMYGTNSKCMDTNSKGMEKTRVQMNEKTRIQTRIQMYEKKHEYKHVYKCIKKTKVGKNRHTNILIYWSDGQSITAPREHGGTVPFPRAPQP